MEINNINTIYFIGIGGIGMSALARFFKEKGAIVSGYDKTPSPLIRQLQEEGIEIHFSDETSLLDKAAEVIVYTPAIPKDNKQLNWYRDNGYTLYKRSDILQLITEDMYAITVAGTHGKTTISSFIAHLLRHSIGCNAFLGGLPNNYDTNYWGSDNNIAVIEADEYDRSFLKLKPDIAILTAMDADHLDIYQTVEALEEAFIDYTRAIKPQGTLWVKHGLPKNQLLKASHKYSYSLQNEAADIYADQIQIHNGGYTFDLNAREWAIAGLRLNIGGMHNIENCVVAVAVAKQMGVPDEQIKQAVESFSGVKRRFEYVVKSEKIIYIDDYAHHPAELRSLIRSAKTLFPGKKCVLVFQPHLYSRTKDLADDFASSLDMADEIILLDIYPARELPMKGVSSRMLADRMANPDCTILSKEGVLSYVRNAPLSLFITAGAGDIDQLVNPIKEIIESRLY